MQTTRILALLFACVGIARAALPSIDTQPANAAACVGSPASFTVVASSDSTTNYQWYFADGVATNAITDATNATYSIASVAPANAGGYSVVVTNNDGSVTSIVATLTVNALPSVSVNSPTICSNSSATLTATTGASSPSYLWSPGGATTASIIVSPAATTTYTVLVTDGVTGCTNSASGTVTVNPLPTVSANSVTVCSNTPGVLTATTDASNPSYLWTPGGQTTASVTNTPTVTTVYTVRVTDGVTGCTNSASGTITVQPRTTATALTSISFACPGSSATFGPTTPSGTGPFTFQWTSNGVPISGATASSYTVPNVTTASAATYCVEVTGTCNTVTNCATLTVASAPTITTQPKSITVPMGNGTVFSVVAGAGATPSYQWKTNGVNVTGATASTFSISNLTLIQNGTLVSVLVSNCSGSTILSSAATLTVRPITGISFDFDTPGQWTNSPFNLRAPGGVDWIGFGAAANGAGANPASSLATIPAGGAQLQMFEVSTGGVGAAVGGGAIDYVHNGAGDIGALLLPVGYDFSSSGKVLTASITFKMKNVVAANARALEFGFTTTTNYNNQYQTLNGNDQCGWMAAILQSTAAGNGTYGVRAQHKVIAGTAAIEVFPANTTTNGAAGFNTTPGSFASTGTNGWYQLVSRFMNVKSPGVNNSNITVETWVRDLGPFGTNYVGAIVLAHPAFTITNGDMVNQTNLFLAIRHSAGDQGGIDYLDNIFITTATGPVAFVAQPSNVSALEGRVATFKALVDGDGPYTYQWFKNGVPIAGAGDWKYTTPSLLLSDSGTQYTVSVTSTNNSITSSPATVTVSADPLLLVSVGSVDGGVIGVRFNELVNPVAATVPGNYLVNGVAAIGAQMRPNGSDVLITPPTTVSGAYTVTVANVTTPSGTALGGSLSATGRVEGLTGYDVDANSSGFFMAEMAVVNVATIVGAVGTYPGDNYSFAPGNFELTAGGHDIFSTYDGLRFVYKQITGDFDIKMRVINQDAFRFSQKCGLHARISLDAFSPMVGVFYDAPYPQLNKTEGTGRIVWAGPGNSWGTNTAAFYPNAWLRFRRSGDSFLRYSSTNGVNWLCDGQFSPESNGQKWPDTLYVGIAANVNVGTGNPQFPVHSQMDGFDNFAGYPGAAISITTQPAATATVAAGATATITVVATAANVPQNGLAGELSYLWQKTNSLAGGWTNMPNAGITNAVFTTPALSGIDNGTFFRVIVTAPGAAPVTSTVLQVTITDATAPTLTINGALANGYSGVFVPTNALNTIVVNYSEFVSAASALNPANYTITNGAGVVIGIASITFNWTAGDQRQVLITTSSNLPPDTYGLRISGVQDQNGNTIATITRSFFQAYNSPFPPVVMEVYWHLANVTNVVFDTNFGANTLLNTNDYITHNPQYTTYSNVFGWNWAAFTSQGGVADNYGVRMYSFFVPTNTANYTFWWKADDYAVFAMNTNAANSTDPAGKTGLTNGTGNAANQLGANNPNYILSNSFATPLLQAGQKYYLEFTFKETGGGDGGALAVTIGTTNTGASATPPATTTVIGADLLRYPDIANFTPVPKMIVENYTNLLYSGQSLFPSQVVAANGNKSDLVNATNLARYISSQPDLVGYMKYSGFQTNLGQSAQDNYLGKIYGYFVPPTNGNYKFWIRSDDASQLFMNTNVVNSTDPAGKNFMAEIPLFINVNYLSNKVVTLVGGQRYYIEGIWREGGGGDGMSIAVRSGADNTVPTGGEMIPSSMLEFPTNLLRLGAVNANLAGSNGGIGPKNPTVTEGSQVTFYAQGIAGAPPYNYLWLKNGQIVEGVVNSGLAGSGLSPYYRTTPLTFADNGAVYSLVVSNQFSVITQSSTISVTLDTTAPTIVSAVGSVYDNTCLITFNENVDPFTASQLSNYRINGGVTVLSATFDPVKKNRVALVTTLQTPGQQYTVTVNGVRDASLAGNAMVNVMANFTAWGYGGLGTVYVEYWTNKLGGSFDALLTDPRYVNNEPDGAYYTNNFVAGQFATATAPAGNGESGRNYWGARITGMFMPPSNGLYRFFVRADDGSKLFMNTNGPDAAGAVVIAQNLGANSSTYYNGQGANGANGQQGSASRPISLTNGTPYFMQAVFGEGTGGDGLEVVFRAVDVATLTDYPPLGQPTGFADTIGGGFFRTTGNPDQIKFLIGSQPPAEITVYQSDPVLLELIANVVPASMAPFATYQWQKTNSGSGTFTNIPGATVPSLFFYANIADDGVTYRLVATIPGTSLILPTLLHVIPDTTPPYIVSVSSLDGTTIGVHFDGPVETGIATEPSGYYFDVPFENAVVSTATLKPGDPTRVLLTVDPLSIPYPIYGDFTLYKDQMADFAGNESFNLSATGAVQRLKAQDIGTAGVFGAGGYNPALPGSTWTDTNGGFDISANGWDIWDAADGFHFTYRQVTGNFDIKTRINKFTGADRWSKAGLMARPSTNSNSRMFYMCAVPTTTPIIGQVPNNFFAAQYRDTDGGAPGNAQNAVPPSYPNAWVRLQRSNAVFYGYWSTNGTDWTVLLQRDTAAQAGGAFPDTLQVGLGTTSHDQNTPFLDNNAYVEYRDLYFPPGAVITAQPEPTEATITIGINQSVTFSNVVATGNLQWRRNGIAIPGATGTSFTIADTSVSDSGTYNVSASTDGGGQISSNIYLVVTNQILIVTNDSITATQNVAYTFPSTLLTGNDFDPEGDPLSILAVYSPHTLATNFDAGLLAGMTLYGPTTNAYWTNQTGVGNSGALHLNNSANNALGSAIINQVTPGARVLAFTANFNLRIGDGSAEPADGFSFNFAADLPNDGSAPNAAEQGVGTGFSFCVDNYRFAPLNVGGPANTPTPVGQTAQANTSGLKIQYGNIILAGVQTPVWNNTAYIPVSITIDIFGNLTVMVNGTNAFARTIPWVPTAGRFGFYARTGGQSQAHWIDDLDIRLIEEDSARGGLVSLSGTDVTYTPPAGACGTDSFYYLVSDGQVGGTNAGLVTVNILTTNGPSVTTCVPNQNVSAGASCLASLPDLRSQLVASDCGNVTVTQDPAPGTLVPLGPLTVTFGVTNTSGLGTNCQATITVVDTTAPVAICPGNITAEATSASGAAVSFSTSGTDNCSVSSVVANPASGSTFAIGVTTVTVTATDGAGNTNACTFTVTVRDTTGPSINCPANQIIACSATNGAIATYSASATDAVDPSPTVIITPPSGSLFPVGTNAVLVTAYDASGNTNTCTFNIVVQDQTPASLTITKADTNAIVCWPQTCTTYTLESTTNLVPPIAWSAVGLPVDVAGTNYCVTVPIAGPGTNTFFRLYKP